MLVIVFINFIKVIYFLHYLQVFLTVKGLRGKIPKTRLTKKAGSVRKNSKVAFRFSKGSTHLFKIRGPEIGDLKSIIVEVKIVHLWVSFYNIIFVDFLLQYCICRVLYCNTTFVGFSTVILNLLSQQ